MSDQIVQSSSAPQMPANRKQEEKPRTPEQLAMIEAMWKGAMEYDPRTEVKVPEYELLDAASKERLDGVAREVIRTIYTLATMEMKPSTLKAFNHPPVYALFFALSMDTFPDVVDAIIRYSLNDAIRTDILQLVNALNKLLLVVKEIPNNTLHPYIIEQALAYIPNHPRQTIGDVVGDLPGFGASADRDTEDTIFGGEA